MHILRLKLNTNKREEATINKRFYAISHIHNVVVKHAKKLLAQLEHDKQYQSYLAEYKKLLKKEKLSKEDSIRKKELSSLMKQIRTDLGLTKTKLETYTNVLGKRYSKLVSSQQRQKETNRVWVAVEDYLFNNGKQIHYKKNRDFDTISSKSNTNGVIFNKEEFSIEWLDLNLQCKLPKSENELIYIVESLKDKRSPEEQEKNNLISFCEIERKMFPNGWHYYVIVYIKGPAPKKLKINKNAATNTTGIDIGTSTIATVSNNKVMLKELAPNCKKYNKKIEKLNYSLDISRRLSNPDKYNPDGTIRKGNKDKWVYSKSYYKKQNKLKSLYRQKSAYIKQCHEELCNELLLNSTTFIVEHMNFKALQRRVKNTDRSEKETKIKQKNGTFKTIKKFKKKKRFGKSLNNRAPATLLTILERKCNQYEGVLLRVNTQTFKSSQYDHVANTNIKTTLKDRSKLIDGNLVQRDLYSAFLLKNSNSKLTLPDRSKCISSFNNFLKLQNNIIEEMKSNNISMKQCFGF